MQELGRSFLLFAASFLALWQMWMVIQTKAWWNGEIISHFNFLGLFKALLEQTWWKFKRKKKIKYHQYLKANSFWEFISEYDSLTSLFKLNPPDMLELKPHDNLVVDKLLCFSEEKKRAVASSYIKYIIVSGISLANWRTHKVKILILYCIILLLLRIRI